MSATPRPFLRWAGSKRNLLTRIIEVVPETFGHYFEPFLGGGSLFFLLEPKSAVLGDSCSDLIETYEALRLNPEAVLRHLAPLRPDRDLYYAIRAQRSRGRYKRAAQFIYLNRTCWNGLYRVNSRGQFNVPFGRPKTEQAVDEANLLACSRALAHESVALRCADFADTLSTAGAGDLVFLDPPYVTRHNDNGFIDYNEQLFSWSDQVRLAEMAHSLGQAGAHVLVTNALHADVIALYNGFEMLSLDRSSTLASNASKRGRVSEALFWWHGKEV